MAYRIFLVHGTFATRASWTLNGSYLRSKLTALLAPESVSFEPIDWTGRNTAEARFQAAKDLQKALRASLQQFPDADHLIVSHSHGGNIALYALRDSFLAERVRVVCMSTPFIHVRDRPVSDYQMLGLGGLRFVLRWGSFVTAIALSVWAASSAADRHQLSQTWQIALFLLLLGAFVVWGRFLMRGPGLPRPKISASDFRLPALGSARVLILRMTGDEAAGGLGFAFILAWASGRVARAIDRICTWPVRMIVRPIEAAIRRLSDRIGGKFVGGAFFLLWIGSILAIQWVPDRAFPYVYGPYYAIVFATWLVLLLSALIALHWLLFQALSAAAFGFDLVKYALSFDVSVEPAPPGSFELHQLWWPPVNASKGLQHSACYNHPDAVVSIARYMAATRERSESSVSA